MKTKLFYLASALAVVTACATGTDETGDGTLGDIGDVNSGNATGNANDDGGGIANANGDDGSSPVFQAKDGSALQGNGPQDAAAKGVPDSSTTTSTDASTGGTDSGTGNMVNASTTDAGCTLTTTNLLSNAAFDTNVTPWTQSSPIITLQSNVGAGFTAQSPAYVAWLGGDYSATDTIYQAVAVPPKTTALHLKGYKWFTTRDLPGYDILSIQTRSSAGAKLEELASLSPSATNDGMWIAFDLAVPSTHSGQTIQIAFISTTDDSLLTNFWIDSLELDATYCK